MTATNDRALMAEHDVVEKEIQAGVASARSSSPSDSVTGNNETAVVDSENDFLTGIRLYTLLIALTFFVLMIALDSAILATAIPYITDDFHKITDVGWYGSAYMIANSSLQPLTGKFYKFFPMKICLLVFVVLFELGSVLCAAANTSTMLVIGRAISGMGSSGLSSGALILVNISAPPDQRPTILGIVMSFFALGQLIGPLIGGALTQHASWRWCFWINLPIGAAAVAGVLAVRLPSQDDKPKITRSNFLKNFDMIGFLLFAPASAMLLIALQWGGIEYAWSSSTIIGLLVGAGVTYILFGIWERRQKEDAMFPASLLRQRVILSSVFVSFLFFGALIIVGYYLPLWFQVIKHASPTKSAVDTLPSFISQIVFAIVVGPVSTKLGFFTPFALVGAAVASLGTGLMTTFTPATTAGKWIGYQILAGGARGLAFQQPINTVQAALKKEQISAGMSIIIWSQFFGGAVFVALGQTTFTALLKDSLAMYAPTVDPKTVINAGATSYGLVVPPAEVPAILLAYNRAITHTYYLPTAISALAALISVGMGWKRVVGDKKPKAKADSSQHVSTSENTKEIEV